MLLSKILKDCKKDIEFPKTAVDSRKVEKGDLFAVFTGSAELNRQYAEDAVRRGAAAVLTDDEALSMAYLIASPRQPISQASGTAAIICFLISAGSSKRGLSSVTIILSASFPARAPIFGRLVVSRLPPQPKTIQSFPSE